MKKLFALLFLSNCFLGCQCLNAPDTPNEDNTILLKANLPASIYEPLQKMPLEIKYYRIVKHKIEGTENEYSNKSLFVRELNDSQSKQFCQLLNRDSSFYIDNETNYDDFEPDKQFIIKTAEGQFNVLINDDIDLLAFINLDGQYVFSIHSISRKKLIELLEF